MQWQAATRALPKIERVLKLIPWDEAARIRNLVQNEIGEQEKKNGKREKPEKKILNNLKNNQDLTSLHMDKTRKLAIMNKTEYMKEETIKGYRSYKKAPKEINTSDDLIKLENWLIDDKPIKYNFILNILMIFRKIKDHKTPYSLRPMVNKIVSPMPNIWFGKIYEETVYENDSSLRCFHKLNKELQKLKEYKQNHDNYMISLDVKTYIHQLI